MDPRIDLLASVLDASAVRHRVIANNVANVNTPGYKRLDVNFETELAKVLANRGDVKTATPVIAEDATAPARQDGNTVDIDREMGQLAKNSSLYQAASTILATRLAMLRSAISGRS